MELRATRSEWVHYTNSDIKRDLDAEYDEIIQIQQATLENPENTRDMDMYNKGYIAAIKRAKQLPDLILKEEFNYGTGE